MLQASLSTFRSGRLDWMAEWERGFCQSDVDSGWDGLVIRPWLLWKDVSMLTGNWVRVVQEELTGHVQVLTLSHDTDQRYSNSSGHDVPKGKWQNVQINVGLLTPTINSNLPINASMLISPWKKRLLAEMLNTGSFFCLFLAVDGCFGSLPSPFNFNNHFVQPCEKTGKWISLFDCWLFSHCYFHICFFC